MFVGHALLAFALAAGGARWTGRSPERSLSIGLAAGAFATVPDVDMLYALVGLLSGVGGTLDAVNAFWSASTHVHRIVTHSLVVGVAAALGFALWSRGLEREGAGIGALRTRPDALSGLAVLVALVAVAGLASGSLGLVVMSAFVLAGLAVATLAVEFGGLGPRTVLATALLGLLSHPFGDLFTGEPPRLLYPFGARLLTDRVLLSPDSTLHLLGTFGVELATIWLAALVYCRLTHRSLRTHVRWRAALGVAYAGAALALPAPTVDSSYRFVFSVLAVGAVGPAPLVGRAYRERRAIRGVGRTHGVGREFRTSAFGDEALTPLLTGLAAITLAGISFAVVHSLT
ncbi:metal-dependent hydrolase [Halalkalicoccus ordinarius]|uniref:metal-dependent hydrolase n=1 Tax=Halalkalicoccus ordinarius TaxID=3116651 RepID=UPI00300F509C